MKINMLTDKKGCYYFEIKTNNGNLVAKGKKLNTQSECEKAIKQIREFAPHAEIVDYS